jgi:hypothetical protein
MIGRRRTSRHLTNQTPHPQVFRARWRSFSHAELRDYLRLVLMIEFQSHPAYRSRNSRWQGPRATARIRSRWLRLKVARKYAAEGGQVSWVMLKPQLPGPRDWPGVAALVPIPGGFPLPVTRFNERYLLNP